MKYTQEQLKKLLAKHAAWLENNSKGARLVLHNADLSFANLSGANLSVANLHNVDLNFANLSGANLSGANLRNVDLNLANLSGANLSDANLRNVDLSDANLSFANLSGANLRNVDLSFANLRSADLGSANLSYANLSKATLSNANITNALLPSISIVPEEGPFRGYKKLADGIIATLLIPRSAQRVNSTGRKCRASKVKVLKLEKNGRIFKGTAMDRHTGKLQYKTKSWVKPDSFNDDFREECTHGIHFFITKKEAADY